MEPREYPDPAERYEELHREEREDRLWEEIYLGGCDFHDYDDCLDYYEDDE